MVLVNTFFCISLRTTTQVTAALGVICYSILVIVLGVLYGAAEVIVSKYLESDETSSDDKDVMVAVGVIVKGRRAIWMHFHGLTE